MTHELSKFPRSVNIGDQMKAVNEALTPKSTNSVQTASANKAGTITNDQCKNSIGKREIISNNSLVLSIMRLTHPATLPSLRLTTLKYPTAKIVLAVT